MIGVIKKICGSKIRLSDKVWDFLELIMYLLLAFVAAYLVVRFVGQRTVVDGDSMNNTLSDGDNIIVEKLSYTFGDVERYDIIVFPFYDENKGKEVYYIKRKDIENEFDDFLRRIFEDEKIEKFGFELGRVYILLKQIGINVQNLKYDVSVASYILDPTEGKYLIDNLMEKYLELNISEYLESNGANENTKQITLFETQENSVDLLKYKTAF